MSECTLALIEASADRCAYVQAHCGDQWDYVPFINFYYCNINESMPIAVIVSLLVVAFVFNFLGTTADRFLAPALETITEKLKLSEAIAGCTLLALANGATDVIAGLAAGGKDDGGLSIAIGGLFGACLFTVTCVLARCIAGAGEIKVDAAGLKRDVFFLLLATLYFMFLTAIKKITWFYSLGFFVIYFIFIGYVVYTENQRRKVEEEAAKAVQAREAARVLAQNRWSKVKQHLLPKQEETSTEDLWTRVLTPYLLKSIVVKRTNRGLKRGLTRSLTTEGLGTGDVEKDIERVKEEAEIEDEEEEDNSLFGRIMRVYNAPLLFVRNLTMPPFEEDNWSVYMAAATPIFGFLFILWQVGLVEYFDSHIYFWIVAGVIAASLTVLILVKGRSQNLAASHGGILASITFAVSALWLNIIAKIFMDLLSLITLISGLPLNYLSLTLLAWGNSLDDFFIDYVIAKSGHGRMAVTGVYGGQLFNLLVGFGGSLLLQSRKGELPIDIYTFGGEVGKENVLTIVLLVTLIAGLVLTIVIAKINNWVLGKKMMVFVTLFYGAFLVAASVITLAWNPK